MAELLAECGPEITATKIYLLAVLQLKAIQNRITLVAGHLAAIVSESLNDDSFTPVILIVVRISFVGDIDPDAIPLNGIH